MSPENSACRKTHLGILCRNNELTKNWCFNANPNLSSFVHFFVSGPLRGLKFVPEEVFGHTDSIDNLSMRNICKGFKNGIFPSTGDLAKNDKISMSAFFSRLSPQETRRVEKLGFESGSSLFFFFSGFLFATA